MLAGGSYKVGVDLDLNKAIEVGGEPGAAPNIVFAGNHAAMVGNAGATLHDVRLSLAEETMIQVLQLASGTVERVYADGSNGGACVVERGTIADSACLGMLAVSPGSPGKFQATVRNVTATPLLIGAFEGAILSATVVNTIALPDPGAGSSKSGLLIDVSAGSSAAVVLSSSSYNSVETTLSSGTNFSFTPAGTNGNQTAAPQLVDAAAGNFRPLASSPTIDAGSATPPLGAIDLDGAPRSQPRCIGGTPVPDIGAYEFTPTEPCAGPPAPANGFRFGKLKRNLAKGTVTLTAIVPGPGELVLSGKGLVRRQLATSGAKPAKLLVKATGAKAKKLRDHGKLKARPLVVFTPTGGTPRSQPRPLVLRLR